MTCAPAATPPQRHTCSSPGTASHATLPLSSSPPLQPAAAPAETSARERLLLRRSTRTRSAQRNRHGRRQWSARSPHGSHLRSTGERKCVNRTTYIHYSRSTRDLSISPRRSLPFSPSQQTCILRWHYLLQDERQRRRARGCEGGGADRGREPVQRARQVMPVLASLDSRTRRSRKPEVVTKYKAAAEIANSACLREAVQLPPAQLGGRPKPSHIDCSCLPNAQAAARSPHALGVTSSSQPAGAPCFSCLSLSGGAVSMPSSMC